MGGFLLGVAFGFLYEALLVFGAAEVVVSAGE